VRSYWARIPPYCQGFDLISPCSPGPRAGENGYGMTPPEKTTHHFQYRSLGPPSPRAQRVSVV
jgi:hypothetical protein